MKTVVMGDVAEEFARDPKLAKVKGCQLIKPYQEPQCEEGGERGDEEEEEEAEEGEDAGHGATEVPAWLRWSLKGRYLVAVLMRWLFVQYIIIVGVCYYTTCYGKKVAATFTQRHSFHRNTYHKNTGPCARLLDRICIVSVAF